jgi:rubrerythrin
MVFQTWTRRKAVDIFEFAMQMERDGETFYRRLALRTADAGVKRILTMLAEDEVKHYNVVKQMRESAESAMPATSILADAKNVFAQMAGHEVDLGGTEIDLYREAQEIERKSRVFYQEKAQEIEGEARKALLLKIADEENRHYFLLDHMIEFVSRPKTWIEDAEFNHLEEY